MPALTDCATWAWQLHALCRGMPPTVFYPPEDERGPRRRRRQHRAKRICRHCPVKNECLEHALTWPELDGVWGETTPAERISMRDALQLK